MRFLDGFEPAFKRQELSVLSEFKRDGIAPDANVLREYDLYQHVVFRCVVGSCSSCLRVEKSIVL